MVTVRGRVVAPEAAAPSRVREHERGLHEVVVRFDGVTGRRLGVIATLSNNISHQGKEKVSAN